MPMFILTLDWTDQGIRAVKQAPKRGKAAKELAKKLGIEVKQTYLTSGEGTTSPNSRSPLAHWETSAPAPREPGPKPNSISSSLSYRDLALQPERRCCEPVVKRDQSTRMPRPTMQEKFSGPD